MERGLDREEVGRKDNRALIKITNIEYEDDSERGRRRGGRIEHLV